MPNRFCEIEDGIINSPATTPVPRRRPSEPALLWLALLLAGRLCHAQSGPLIVSPAVEPPPAHSAAAPATYDQDFAALCKAVGGHFYDAGFNGLDWPRVQAEYAPRVKSVTSDAQFLTLMNGLLARLHASHTRLYGPDNFEFYLLPEVVYGQPNTLRYFLPQQAAGGLRDTMRQPFQIGCLPSPDDPARVAAVLDGTPAAGAGLRAGDELVSVDGRPYHGLTQFGPTPVRLGYRRQGVEATVTVTPTAATALDLMLAATEKSARIIPLPDGRRIGYVHLWCMGDFRFQAALEGLVTGRLHDTDGFVLDLRQGYGGSPSGYADPFFLPDFEVTARLRQTPPPTTRHEGYGKPLVVIVDHGTRSAKEWLAWTFQESKRATLVGQQTAGAVLGLGVFPVGTRFLLELAVEDLTLNGIHLEGRGVAPDIALAGTPSDDAYLQAALQVFSGRHGEGGGKVSETAPRSLLPPTSPAFSRE